MFYDFKVDLRRKNADYISEVVQTYRYYLGQKKLKIFINLS